MKKLIVVFASIALTAGAYAQTDSTVRKSTTDINNNADLGQNLNNNENRNALGTPGDKPYPDGVVFLNGQVMKVKNGVLTVLDQDMTMSNGTKVMSDGTYIKKDGTKFTLKEGDQIGVSGNLVPAKSNKDKNMYLVPDSTKK